MDLGPPGPGPYHLPRYHKAKLGFGSKLKSLCESFWSAVWACFVMSKRKLDKDKAVLPAEKKSYQPRQVMENANKRAVLSKLWDDLKMGVLSVYEMKALEATYELELYTLIDEHCTNGFFRYDPARQSLCRGRVGETILLAGYDIYLHLQRWIKEHIGTLLKEFKERTDADPTKEFALKLYVEKFTNFNSSTEKLQQIFEPLNRSFVQPQLISNLGWCGKVYEVNRLAMLLFRKHFFDSLKEPVCNAALTLVDADRMYTQCEADMGNVAALIKSLVNMGVDPDLKTVTVQGKQVAAVDEDLTIYQEAFEGKLLQDTQRFYRDTAAEFIKTYNPVAYMQKVEEYMAMEDNRIRNLFHRSSKQKIDRLLRQVLIQDHLDLIHGQFRPLLESEAGPEREKNLRCLYSLITQLDTPGVMANMINLYGDNVTNIGRQELEKVIQELSMKGAPLVFVSKVMHHFTDNIRIIRDVFQNGQAFNNALYLGIRNILADNIVNNAPAGRRPRSAELMARYCDMILRDKTLNEEQLDENFSKIARLFQLLDDRDVFMRCSVQLMAVRLTQGKSNSDDAERQFIEKLGFGEGNNDVTQQLSSLFFDYNLSRDLAAEFTGFMNIKNTKFGFDFTFHVIRSSVWLFEKEVPQPTLPANLHLPMSEFHSFYLLKHVGRKFTWLSTRFSGEIRYFPPENQNSVYTLELSGYQILILLLFEHRDSMTIQEISAETTIEVDVVKQIVSIFLRCKLFVLKPECVNPELDETTRVYLFRQFKNKKTHLALNVPLGSETRREEQKMDKDIDVQRGFLLQALIVRIMKATQHRTLSEITVAVGAEASSIKSAIAHKPQPTAIRKCIEYLLESGYIERDEKDRRLFHYIA